MDALSKPYVISLLLHVQKEKEDAMRALVDQHSAEIAIIRSEYERTITAAEGTHEESLLEKKVSLL